MKPASFLCCAFLAAVVADAPAPAAALQDQAVEVGPGITPPQAAGPLFIETPEGVNDANANATVTVRLLLDKSGRVRQADAKDAPDPLLAQAAAGLLMKMTFPPARRDNKPVVVWFDKSVMFRSRHLQQRSEAPMPAPPPSAPPRPPAAPSSTDCVPAPYDVDAIPDLPDGAEFPRLISKVDPEYPPSLMQERITGDVRFACVVDTCGHVQDCRVMQTARDEFMAPGLDAVEKRIYEPARLRGTPLTSVVAIRLTFKIAVR